MQYERKIGQKRNEETGAYENIEWFELPIRCNQCGNQLRNELNILTKQRYETETEVKQAIKENKPELFGRTCNNCLNANAWRYLIAKYKIAAEGDKDMLMVLEHILTYLITTKKINTAPTPLGFKRMLEDRGVIINNAILTVWNLVSTECEMKSDLANIPRWRENDIANAVTGFLKKARIF